MSRSQSPPRRLRACVPCSKARARCHFKPNHVEQHLCDRCERLEIVCEAKTSKSLRRPRRFRDVDSQGLPPSMEGGAPGIPTGEASRPLGAASSHDSISHDQYSTRDIDQGHQSTLPSNDDGEKPPRDLTWPQVERMLDIFRDKYMPSFPFVLIDKSISTRQLRQEKPIVFQSILLIAAPLPTSRIRSIKKYVLGYLGQQLLAEDERTLDMLQGLLICIAWGDLNSIFDQQVTTLVYLALGCAHTLGITKIPLPVLRQLGKDKAPEDVSKNADTDKLLDKMHTLEEQRAFLGCYYLLSVKSVHFSRKNPLGGQHVSICCDSLRKSSSYPSDFLLERTIRMTQMGEQLSQTFGAPSEPDRGMPYLALLEGKGKGFKIELDRILESLGQFPEESEVRKKYFVMHYHYLIIRLNEPATHLKEIFDGGGGPSMHRSVCLRHCLVAAREYFDVLFTLPEDSYLYQPLAFMEQVTFVMVIATRLLLVHADASDWDVEHARQMLDFADVAGRIADRVDKAEKIRKENVRAFTDEMGIAVKEAEMDSESHFATLAHRTRLIKLWFEARLRDETTAVQLPPQGHVAWDSPEQSLWEGGTLEYEMGSSFGWFGGFLGNLAWNFDDVNI